MLTTLTIIVELGFRLRNKSRIQKMTCRIKGKNKTDHDHLYFDEKIQVGEVRGHS